VFARIQGHNHGVGLRMVVTDHGLQKSRRSRSKTIPRPSVSLQDCVKTIQNSTTLSEISE